MRFLRPSLLVELGTWNGDSFFAFCQSVADHALSTRCYAVDHWKGDKQTGRPDDAQFSQVLAYCSATYPEFAYLMRNDFTTAAREFRDETIDLLHIDGLHTYEAVSGDFATWFPKVRPGGVVLFHDICVRSNEIHRDFGVWKLWDELKEQHPTFQFPHAYGLGILVKNDNPDVETWLRTATETSLRAYYVRRGTDLVAIMAGRQALNDRDALADQCNSLRHECDALRQQIVQCGDKIARLEEGAEHLKITRFEAKRECHSMKTSLSWRLTWPLRILRDKAAALRRTIATAAAHRRSHP